jgi:hypothetical protein
MPAERTFTIESPVEAFPINACFNQFSIEKDAGWLVLNVGYLTKGRLLDDVFSFALSKETLDQSRESTLEYLGRLGEMLPMEHFIVPSASKVIAANVINLSYRNDVSEVILANFTFRRIMVESKESAFEADPVALLRSPLNVQRNLIRALYQ